MDTLSSTNPSQTSCDLTVYHDGDCPICSVEIGHYQKLAGAERIRFVDAAKADEGAFGPDLDRDRALARFHVRRADGQLLSGAAAFAALWETLPRYQRFGRMAQFPAVLPLLDVMYRVILPIRAVLSGALRRIRQG